jgi:hypothetical protein
MQVRKNHVRTIVVAAAASTFALGAASGVSATTEPPTDTATMGTEAAPPADGSVSPDVAAFCEAEVAVEAAVASGDPAAIGPALEGVIAAAPEDIRPTVETVAANAENPESPEFAEAYSAMIEYMKANCGYAELGVSGSEYAFGGIPEEVPAGPTIVTFENIGEEVHEFVVYRINDDVTMTVEELLALPEEEAESMVTAVAQTFAFPGQTGYTVADLTPGRYVALCFVPQGLTPEVIAEIEAAESSVPAGSAPVGTEHAEMTTDAAADTAPADTATMESAPSEGSAPTGSAPPGEGPPHFTLGMIQEFTVV